MSEIHPDTKYSLRSRGQAVRIVSGRMLLGLIDSAAVGRFDEVSTDGITWIRIRDLQDPTHQSTPPSDGRPFRRRRENDPFSQSSLPDTASSTEHRLDLAPDSPDANFNPTLPPFATPPYPHPSPSHYDDEEDTPDIPSAPIIDRDPPLSDVTFHLAQKNLIAGPYSHAQIFAWSQSGHLTHSDFIHSSETDRWETILSYRRRQWLPYSTFREDVAFGYIGRAAFRVLLFAIAGYTFLPVIGWYLAIVLGHVALDQLPSRIRSRQHYLTYWGLGLGYFGLSASSFLYLAWLFLKSQ